VRLALLRGAQNTGDLVHEVKDSRQVDDQQTRDRTCGVAGARYEDERPAGRPFGWRGSNLLHKMWFTERLPCCGT
jgi:hypothetical protein